MTIDDAYLMKIDGLIAETKKTMEKFAADADTEIAQFLSEQIEILKTMRQNVLDRRVVAYDEILRRRMTRENH